MPTTDVSPISVPYPDTAARELRVSADACQLRIRPGAGEEWVAGTYRDPSGQRSPQLSREDGTLTIDHVRATPDVVGELVAGDPRFDLQLGTAQSYALSIDAAAIQVDAELGGLPLTRLTIDHKAGRSRLSFGQANPQSVELVRLSAEGATIQAGNLANANAAAIAVEGDATSYRLDFGGALQRSTQVVISTRASSVELIVPAATPARIASASLLTDLDVGDGFRSQDGVFWTPAAAMADGPFLTIDASIEVGQLTLRMWE